MNIAAIARLFDAPTTWPPLPPWWLVSSTDVAAFLNVSPKTLHVWRVRGFGPPVFPPMYHRPTQGAPLYYEYGHLRAWVAERLGLQFTYSNQCEAYLAEHASFIATAKGSLDDKIDFFEKTYRSDRQRIRAGQAPKYFPAAMIEEVDQYYARQPKRISVSTQGSPAHATGNKVAMSVTMDDSVNWWAAKRRTAWWSRSFSVA